MVLQKRVFRLKFTVCLCFCIQIKLKATIDGKSFEHYVNLHLIHTTLYPVQYLYTIAIYLFESDFHFWEFACCYGL